MNKTIIVIFFGLAFLITGCIPKRPSSAKRHKRTASHQSSTAKKHAIKSNPKNDSKKNTQRKQAAYQPAPFFLEDFESDNLWTS